MQLGIVADTHDNVPAVRAAIGVFEEHEIDVILHCGDVIAPPVIAEFDGFEFHLVFGNNDGERDGLRRAVTELGRSSECHDLFADVTFDDVDIAMLHGENLDQVDAIARSGRYDYLLYGHHHETRRDDVDGTVVLNPGGHFPTIPSAHRSVAVIDTAAGTDAFVRVDAGGVE